MKVRQTLLCLFVLLAAGCSEDEDDALQEKKPTAVVLNIPANFPEPVYDLGANPLTEEGIALGKMLFYDAALSRDNTISCGFCHQQPTAFTHMDTM